MQTDFKITAPVLDMNVIQKAAQDAAMKAALEEVKDYYLGYNSPYRKQLKEYMAKPRSSFKLKPVLPAGTILTVKEKWQNFHGVYYRCYLPDEMKDKGYSIPYYDIPADKAKVIEL